MKCSTPDIQPCLDCKNPLDFLFENAYNATLGLIKPSLIDALDSILEVGLFIPTCNICCPACDGVYFLSSVETSLSYYEGLGFDDKCCIKLYSGIESALKFKEALRVNSTEYKSNACCYTEFDECLNKLICWSSKPELGASEFVAKILFRGLVEYNILNNPCDNEFTSGLCYINNFFNKYCDYNLRSTKVDFIERLLEKGILIACETDKVIISSIGRYINYKQELLNNS